MLTLYGIDLSTPCNKVRFVANALGIPYEYKRINLAKGEHKKPDYLKLHPAGKVPAIQDEDFVLFESNAIIKYLAQKESSELYPKNLTEQAIIDQWMDFCAIHVNQGMGRVFFNRVLYQAVGAEKDERSLQDGLNFLANFIPVLESQLQTHEFLAGSKLSLADFCLLATLDPAEVSQVSLETYPKLQAWRKKLQAKDFYQKCFKSYGEMLQALQIK